MKPPGVLQRGPWLPSEQTIARGRDWRHRSQQAAIERARQKPYRPPVHTPSDVVDLIIARSNRLGLAPLPRGRCELCGAPATNTHTRRPNGKGGTSRPENYLASNKIRVCGHGNATGCHSRIELNRTWAHEHGLLLWQTQDPAVEPVDLLVGRVRLSDNDDRYLPEREVAA